ncbi:multidrug effflux MFS transporter [Amorphus sp. 3PC139-8]|uniref:multidrug effflux MFS transporter n=1 Tax=Amorphus sp. 3PC139-8 TaxID=2735676 RepID=UPI00345D6ABA
MRPVFLDRATPPTIGTLIALAGIAAMSMNVFLPALPEMAADFGTDYGVIQLSVGLFLAFVAVTQIVLGPAADRFGRRNVMLFAFGTYALSSLGCALAQDVSLFLVLRMVQAIVYSGIALARTIVRDTMSTDKAASRIAYITMGMAVLPMISPTFGGLISEAVGWRFVFWLMFALGLIGLMLVWLDVGETRPAGFTSFRDQIRSYPVLLSSGRFWCYCIAMAAAAGTFFSYLGAAPFIGAEIFRLDSGTLGILFGSTSVGYVSGSFLAGRLSIRFGVRRMMFAGAITTASALAVSLTIFLLGKGSAGSFFGLMAVVGAGYGITLPNAMTGLLSVDPKLAASASGVGSAVMVGGGAALSALAGAVMVAGAGPERLLLIQFASALTGLAATLLLARLETRA